MAQAGVNLNGIFQQATNAFNGVNAGQAQVTSSGQVQVPTTQAGNGIFAQLVTVGSQLVNKYIQDRGVANVQVQSPAAAAIGGAPLVGTTGGGVVITLPGSNNGGVTDPNKQPTQLPVWLWPVVGVVGVVVLFLMFFKRGRRR
jgi:hypothetical protein